MADPALTTDSPATPVAAPSAAASRPAPKQPAKFSVGDPGPRGGIVMAVKVVQGDGEFIQVGSTEGDWLAVSDAE
jgi:hypothetical protein